MRLFAHGERRHDESSLHGAAVLSRSQHPPSKNPAYRPNVSGQPVLPTRNGIARPFVSLNLTIPWWSGYRKYGPGKALQSCRASSLSSGSDLGLHTRPGARLYKLILLLRAPGAKFDHLVRNELRLSLTYENHSSRLLHAPSEKPTHLVRSFWANMVQPSPGSRTASW